MKYVLLAALVALFVMPLAGCPALGIGQRAVDDAVLFEPAELAWPQVAEDVVRGIDAVFADGELTPEQAGDITAKIVAMAAALAAHDRHATREVAWTQLRFWADRGVDAMLEAGEIGPGVAGKHTQHLDEFGRLYLRLTALTPRTR